VSSYYHKFGINDVFYNRIKAHPQNEFFIWNSEVYYNKNSTEVGSFTSSVPCVDNGFINLHELNVDRNITDTGFIYPYVVKTSSRTKLRTMDSSEFDRSYSYGDVMTGNYRLSASIERQYFASGLAGGASNYTGSALRNTFNNYKKVSPYYAYSSTPLSFDKSSDASCLITIPSIFYGSSIKKGTIDLKFYITGTLVGRLQDTRHNGELIQTGPAGSTGSGSIAGVALYNEGFLYLSGAWALDPASYTFDASSTPKWIHFGAGTTGDGLGPNNSRASASFDISFSGSSYVPNITMMAHAKKGELNHSNNWSYLTYGQTKPLVPLTSSTSYIEQDLTIKNTVSSAYADPTGSFQKITYISKVGIYDDDKNLIGIASLAKPVKKTEDRDLTFKLKLDI
jgi:hypothetical protein